MRLGSRVKRGFADDAASRNTPALGSVHKARVLGSQHFERVHASDPQANARVRNLDPIDRRSRRFVRHDDMSVRMSGRPTCRSSSR